MQHRLHACSLALLLTAFYAGCSSDPSNSNAGGGGNGGDSTGTSSSSTGSATASSGSGGSGGSGPNQTLCSSGKYIICEDFEATEVGAVPQGWTKHGDPAAVADDEAASGAHALKLGPMVNGERRIYHDGSKLGSGHWGRIRYKVALPVPDAFVHSTLVALYGDGPTVGPEEVRVVDTVKEDKDGWNNDGNGSHVQYLYNVQPNGAEFGKGSDYSWMFDDQWHCAEWHIDGPTQSYDFYIDDVHVDQISIANGAGNYEGSQIPNAFSEVRIGWTNYQQAPPGFTAWIDDIVLHDERIGCQD
ncbi:hypothetical protein [Polyangium sorediatum]|uniref:GH16 domain-containing protein n=1 Tax=Polyangium sorediatum TaxID=889274 RepID=A0ABT6NL77_9BACT|nr:hypothetical protein [Polyangium sorediatum]MDI1429070.1 hypothetical protein [Polyangium sorediatum]